MSIDQRLSELGITLPEPASPVAAYVPVVVAGGFAHVSGQVCVDENGQMITGKLGTETADIELGQRAARACGLMILAQLKKALGSLDRVERVVNCTQDFTDQPKVGNGASELMEQVFGEAGRHARAAVGAPSLPLGVAVEVDAIVKIRD
jgi:enamine deaminase RidA (YjgF/YER057c/UK114 family)